MNRTLRSYLPLSIRWILALIFLASGIGKLIEPGNARYLVELMATEYYWLIEYSSAIVTFTSILEIVLAVMLIWGRWIEATYLVSALMITFFTLVLGYFWLQGQSIENCGCFGALGIGGGLEASLIRNILMLILVAWGLGLVLKSNRKESRTE